MFRFWTFGCILLKYTSCGQEIVSIIIVVSIIIIAVIIIIVVVIIIIIIAYS